MTINFILNENRKQNKTQANSKTTQLQIHQENKKNNNISDALRESVGVGGNSEETREGCVGSEIALHAPCPLFIILPQLVHAELEIDHLELRLEKGSLVFS